MKKYIILILTLLLSLNLYADDCISFEGVKDVKVVKPIIKELHKLGIDSKVDVMHSCKFKVYLPIDIYAKNSSGDKEIEIHLMLQKSQDSIEEKIINIKEKDAEIYDLLGDKNQLKSSLIKAHSYIIATTLSKELF